MNIKFEIFRKAYGNQGNIEKYIPDHVFYNHSLL